MARFRGGSERLSLDIIALLPYMADCQSPVPSDPARNVAPLGSNECFHSSPGQGQMADAWRDVLGGITARLTVVVLQAAGLLESSADRRTW